ncbi:MAG: tyrosine--tRNA ligase [Patescibacteria group bacterium]|nr:tyrosine--tRNA ligase [Patescibacteria group bacterium]
MKINTNPEKIQEILTKGVERVIEKKSLIKKLQSGRQLRIKFGIDPTAPDLHLGNAVILWKLREFQKLGHKIIFIIGDFTARIGDPSGRLDARKMLSEKEIKENMKTYKKQIGKILDLRKLKLVYNSCHLAKLNLSEIYRIFHFFSVNQILERDMFQERRRKEKPIWLHEFFYPVLQGYDSVAVKADVELGGSDQLFNMIMGRHLQPYFKQLPQDIVTMKLLVGTDGRKKMSKSFGNYIGIQESPEQQYGKIMSIKDELILDYFELCTQLPLKEIRRIAIDLRDKKINPRDLKAQLAREIVSLYHKKAAARRAEKEFERIFKEKKLPKKIAEVKIKEKTLNILDLLVKTRLVLSKSEAKRLILQRGVKIDGKIETDWQKVIEIKKDQVVQVGKRKFIKLIN